MTSDYFAVHAHSDFSQMDGMGTVDSMVERVVSMGQPALALTDHGNLAGSVQLYKACKRAGIAAYPGTEVYVVRDVADTATNTQRYHLGLLALDFAGYQALTRLSTYSWSKERFYYKPLIDFGDLAFLSQDGHADHIAVTTGCYFGLVVQQMMKGGGTYEDARAMTATLAQWFPHLYVELQDHGVVHEEDQTDDALIAKCLYKIAQELGLPVVVGGDSHYVRASEQPVHDLMKDICYFGAGEDNRFPGGPYHLLSSTEALAPFAAWREDIEDGHADLLDKHRLTLPALDNYKFHVPKMVHLSPITALRSRAEEGLQAHGLEYVDYLYRLDEELKVIDTMGMANYFLLVREHVTDWCRQQGIIVNTRGSANGSLVCYVLGITNVDPIKWHTSFDRFLSIKRKKPPDIDIDVDFRGRQRLISHLRSVFPSMVQVGTYARIGITTQEDDFGGGADTGSVFVQYMAAMRKKVPDFAGKVLPEHRETLNRLADTPVNKSMGTNAAGFILPGDDFPIDDYLPLGRIISSDTVVTQMPKDDVEALGYMKMDVLGLRALQTLNGTLTYLGKRPNEWGWIPDDDPTATKLLRSGNCVGLFQYEGYSSQKGGKELRIKSTLDTILGLALYRPALMNGGQKDLYLSNRGKGKARQVRLHRVFDPVLADTAGVPLFQEQVMEMLQTLGMEFEDYNDLMTAVKASNAAIHDAGKTFVRIMPIFYDLCEAKGLSDADADEAWGAVIGFKEYGFNRAHATSYGLMSYRSAYLKAHFPMEYMASLLDVWVGEKKEILYVREARRLGLTVVRADVNHSGASWTVDSTRKDALRKGLVSLKNVGWNVAVAVVENRPPDGYESIQQFIDLNPARPVSGGSGWRRQRTLKGVCLRLQEEGAFRDLPDA